MATKDKNKNSVTKKQLVDKVQGLLELAQKQCDLTGYKERGSDSKDEIPCRLVNKANHILDILMAVPDEANLGYITSVQKVVETSLADIKMDELESQVNDVSAQVEKWIHEHTSEISKGLLENHAKRGQKTRKVAIGVMIVVAIAAIVFFVLESLEVIATNGLIGGLIGLGDILIGIIAFSYELMDDSKTEKACEAVDDIDAVKAVETEKGQKELTAAIEKLTKKLKKGRVVLKTTNNYSMCCTIGSSQSYEHTYYLSQPQAGSESQDRQTPDDNG